MTGWKLDYQARLRRDKWIQRTVWIVTLLLLLAVGLAVGKRIGEALHGSNKDTMRATVLEMVRPEALRPAPETREAEK